MAEYVDCEICNEPILFDNYAEHVETCLYSRNFPITFFEDNDIVRDHVTQNHQIGNNRTLRDFLHDHFNVETPTLGNSPPRSSTLIVQITRISRIVPNTDFFDNVEVGLTPAEIEDVTDKTRNIEITDDERCPICQENIKEIIEPLRLLKCSHHFCDGCISTWLSKHKKCPVCAIDLEDAYLKPGETNKQ